MDNRIINEEKILNGLLKSSRSTTDYYMFLSEEYPPYEREEEIKAFKQFNLIRSSKILKDKTLKNLSFDIEKILPSLKYSNNSLEELKTLQEILNNNSFPDKKNTLEIINQYKNKVKELSRDLNTNELNELFKEKINFDNIKLIKDIDKEINNYKTSIDAYNDIFVHNLRLVVSVASNYTYGNFSFDDLVQDGLIGLSVAIVKYDFSFEAKFSTYAYEWIRNYVGRASNNYIDTFKTPVHMYEKMASYFKFLTENNFEITSNPIDIICLALEKENPKEFSDFFDNLPFTLTDNSCYVIKDEINYLANDILKLECKNENIKPFINFIYDISNDNKFNLIKRICGCFDEQDYKLLNELDVKYINLYQFIDLVENTKAQNFCENKYEDINEQYDGIVNILRKHIKKNIDLKDVLTIVNFRKDIIFLYKWLLRFIRVIDSIVILKTGNCSLDAKLSASDDDYYIFAADPNSKTENEVISEISDKDTVKKILDDIDKNPSKYPSRAKEVLIKRFGLDGSESMTLEDVGKEFGISRERVRQIEDKTLKKLKHIVKK